MWRSEKMWKSEKMMHAFRGKRKRGESMIQVPSSTDIFEELRQLSNTNRYHVMTTPMLTVQFRLSGVPRRDNQILDIDIVQIEIKEEYQRQGNGVQFFKNVVEAAKLMNRGVFLEQCITPASQGLRGKLIELGLATAYKEVIYGPFSALSTGI